MLGRTNQAFNPVWYRPVSGPDDEGLATALVQISGADAVIDVSSQPALWGRYLSGYRGSFLARSSRDLERAVDARHASGLVEAHLIEVLSALGRDRLEFYCLRVRSALPREVVDGAFEALESARQEGMVRFFCLSAESDQAAGELWRERDAFEVLIAQLDSPLHKLARERRAGVVVEGGPESESGGWPDSVVILRSVTRAEEVAR